VLPGRTLVTGGAGFIGSHLVDRLLDTGAEVLVVDDLSHGSPDGLDRLRAAGVELQRVDVRDGMRLSGVVTAFQPEVVFHLVAQIDVRASMANPAHDASVNVLGSVNLFNAALAAGVQRVVNTSTGGRSMALPRRSHTGDGVRAAAGRPTG
jgi:UDP-glucose 4-epimerase